MARRKKSVYPTSVEKAAAPRGPSADDMKLRVRPWFLLRLAVALLVALAGIGSFRSTWEKTAAAVEAKRGWERANRQPGGHIIGMGELRGALRVDPANPDYNLWTANLLFQRESEKVRREAFHEVDPQRFLDALGHLRVAQSTTSNPSRTAILTADAANLLATYSGRAGDSASEERYIDLAARYYFAFREYVSVPRPGQAASYYERAMRRLIQAGRPDRALLLHDDFRLYFPDQARTQREALSLAQAAYRQVGEFPMMMTILTLMAMDDPADLEILGRIQRAADHNRQALHAFHVFDALHGRGELPEPALPVLDQLRRQARPGDGMPEEGPPPDDD